jgi:hypothetical protein
LRAADSETFTIEQILAQPHGILPSMNLQRIKTTLSAVWVFTAVVVAVSLGADLSRPAMMAIAAAGLLPPLAILLLWNEPPQTMSESINEARR